MRLSDTTLCGSYLTFKEEFEDYLEEFRYFFIPVPFAFDIHNGIRLVL